MASLNKVMIIGNLGKDPELSYTAGGDAVTKFSVAANETWTKDGQKQERTEWFNVVCWRKLAETCAQYLAKGRQVYVEGKLQTRTYEQDGQTKYFTEVVADQVRFLGERGETREQAYVEPDDLPF
jgi:single-strand DNA-binding protein